MDRDNNRKAKRPRKDAENKRKYQKCVNRRCRDGEGLVPALEMVCQYYDIYYKPEKMVCKTCVNRSLNYYKQGEKLMKEEKCILESKLPNFESPFVIELSSEDELELQSSASVSNLSTNKKASDCLHKMVDHVLNKNKAIIGKQLDLCDNYMEKQMQQAEQFYESMDNSFLQLGNDMEEMRKMLCDPYKPSVTNESCVDINDTAINLIKNEGYKKTMFVTKKRKQKCLQENEEDETDKDVIAVNCTPYDVPVDILREGTFVYPRFRVGQAVYAKTSNDPESWQRCKIKSVLDNGFMLVCWDIDNRISLHPSALAYTRQSLVRYHVGCRVISKYTQDISSIRNVHFYAGVIAEPPSVLNSFRYMIFFDDGRVQYQHHKNIRLIAHKPQEVWNEINSTDSLYVKFLRQYLENYPDRHMVRLTNNHNITARSGGKWMLAQVVEVCASLVRLKFMESVELEWLYRGSPRLLNIHDKLKGVRMRQSGLEYLNKPFVEFTTTQEELKGEESLIGKTAGKKLHSDSTVALSSAKNTVPKRLTHNSEKQPKNRTTKKTLKKNNNVFSKIVKLNLAGDVPKPQSYYYHNCDQSCVAWTHYDYSKTKHINVLGIPLHFGFNRLLICRQSEDNDTINTTTLVIRKKKKYVYYRCPCGRTIRSMNEMLLYLVATKNKMTIEMFDFNSWVEPLNEFKVMQSIKMIEDISYGKEFRPISCVNTLSNISPPIMNYITARHPMPGVNLHTDPNFLCGCDCTDNCQEKSKCACWQMTIQNQRIIPIDADQYDPNIGYNYRRLPGRVITGIYECNITCKCSKSCLNRIVQLPLSLNLQLFMSEKKGWGVRCLNDIPSGSFICNYVGYLLTENDANHRGLNYGDEYLAELDYIEVVETTKNGYEKTVQLSDDDENSNTINCGNKETESETSNSKDSNEMANRALSLRSSKPKYKASVDKSVPSKSVRDYFGEEKDVYIMDAKCSGNIGRYINHSCYPNMFVQNVFVDSHDVRFPWVSLFADHFIPAGKELTWDYSYEVGSVPGKKLMCYCGSANCRKRLL